MTQPSLFVDLYHHTSPRAMPATARREARVSVEPHLTALHRLILSALEQGPLTDEGIQAATGMAANTERPRRIELLQMARIRAAGEGRTLSGRRATTWGVP